MKRLLHAVAGLLIIFSASAAFAFPDAQAEAGAPAASKDAGDPAYEALLDSADNYIRRERWQDAARCVRHALKLYPASPLNSKLFSNLGVCLTNCGDFSGAFEAFELALVREPDSPETLYSRAIAYMLSDSPDDARRDLQAALAVDSLNQKALRLHGQLSLMAGDTPAASADFQRLKAHFPSDPWGPAGIGECLIDNADNAAAIPFLQQAISLEDNPDFRISLISALMAENKLAEAENTIYESLKLYPREGELYLLRGVLHRTLHQNNDAELDKKIAIEYGVDPQTIEKYLPEIRK